ncbi:MAG: hypothetical protein LC098_00630 [Burkholderiales bacterium]|nr:hypothetical protein [Burkholderiales bacterium]
MPAPLAQANAAELQRRLADLTGHAAAHVRPYGKHLLIQMHRDDSIDTVARLTAVGRDQYIAAFRSHTGRWEPLPGSAADMKQTAELVTTLLASYLEP